MPRKGPGWDSRIPGKCNREARGGREKDLFGNGVVAGFDGASASTRQRQGDKALYP